MRECPACGERGLVRWREASATDPAFAGAAQFTLERCARCGSAATLGPAPDPALYEGGTYAPARGAAAALVAAPRALAERDRMRFLRGVEAGAKVLEIGAGDGRFVARMRAAGLDAWGVDPSARACAAAARAGIRVARAGIDDLAAAEASQDAVVLWHSLEHLEDPAGGLVRIHRILRPGGTIVVAVPNLAGLQARLGGDRWFHQDVPRHRTHFTPAGLGALLDRTGYGVERIHHLVVEQNPLGMWQTLLNLLTAERDFAFRLLKRDLGGVPPGRRARDLAITVLAGAPLAVVAGLLELGAGLARRGGSIVAVAGRTAG